LGTNGFYPAHVNQVQFCVSRRFTARH
jgi:hypothetical protein